MLLPVKIVKLVISDIQSILESQAALEDDDGKSSDSSEVSAASYDCISQCFQAYF